jgi:hypothetical protein
VSDLERVLSEAQKAREEAEAAIQRAAQLEAQAEEARSQAERERAERQRQWAQHIVDTYDADVSEADMAIQRSHDNFTTVARQDLTKAIDAYMAWGEASLRHYALQVRVSAAAAVLNYDASPPEFVTPPLFSDALDAALASRLVERGEEARQEVQAELARLREGADVPPSPSGRTPNQSEPTG